MATTTAKPETLVGKRIRRREDPRLITGTATYVDDIQMPGLHHACIVRSPHGAAKIKSINIKPALEFPGVAAVFTGKDTENVGPVPCGSSLPGLRVPHHHILAIDRVYFVGHPVAVVVATDRRRQRSRESPRIRRARCASGMARQRRVQLSPGWRRY
jgi:carbon-monoxide dehydrogenase large subunit